MKEILEAVVAVIVVVIVAVLNNSTCNYRNCDNITQISTRVNYHNSVTKV